MKNNFEKIVEAVKKAKSVALFCHIGPDADAFGSMFGFYEFAYGLGVKDIDMFADNKYANFLSNIFPCEKLQYFKTDKKYDLCVALDCATFERLGVFGDIFKSCKNTIKIDHHIKTEKSYGKLTYINSKVASASEIVLELAQFAGVKINKNMATYLYAGLLGDSGFFQNSNTNHETFIHASELFKLGADVNKISSAFSKVTHSQINAEKFILKNFKMLSHVAYVIISNKDMQKNKFTRKLRNIDGIKISAIIYESSEKNKYKGSLRSNYEIDLIPISSQFNGGGHKNASGVNLEKNEIKRFLECLAQI